MTDTAIANLNLQEADSNPRKKVWVIVVQIAILALLTAVIYRNSFDSMVYKWINDGNWSHGWLVPVFSIYFLVVHRRELGSENNRYNYLGLIILAGALGTLYLSYALSMGYPQHLSLVPYLIGLTLLVGGWKLLRVSWFPIVYLLFAIPLPSSLYFQITFPLRRLASLVAGKVLHFLPGVFTEVQGVVIDYSYGSNPPGSLNVEDACSGMRLMMAFCSLGVAMAYLGDRPVWQRGIMVLSCIPIAVFCNTLRVFSTGVIHIYGYEDWAQGTPHQLLGLAMLPIALGLFGFVSWVLNNILEEVPEEENGD